MKGLVVEINGNQMVIMDDKGGFYKQKLKEKVSVGQEVDFSNKAAFFSMPVYKTLSAVAAAFIIMIGVSTYAYMTPYSYVSLDINPSMEIVVNRYERVLHINPLNEDANKIIENKSKYSNQKIDDVIVKLVNKAHEENYITDNGTGEVLITVTSPSEEATAAIDQLVEKQAIPEIKENNINANINIKNVTIEKHEQAKKEQVSPGKLILLEKLKEVSPNADLEQVKNQSVKDIMQKIQGEKDKNQESEASGKASDKVNSDVKSNSSTNNKNSKKESEYDKRIIQNSTHDDGRSGNSKNDLRFDLNSKNDNKGNDSNSKNENNGKQRNPASGEKKADNGRTQQNTRKDTTYQNKDNQKSDHKDKDENNRKGKDDNKNNDESKQKNKGSDKDK